MRTTILRVYLVTGQVVDFPAQAIIGDLRAWDDEESMDVHETDAQLAQVIGCFRPTQVMGWARVESDD